jgi:asparagine synthase (glutamine-hydrolysing)
VITAGRVAWDEPDWRRAEGLTQYEGGLSNRLILDQYLSGGISSIERHNGSAIVLVWEPRQQTLHLLTDHFGFYPVFLYRSQSTERCIISTFPDAIADDQVQTTLDYVSMAEFLQEWKTTPPHTYYSEIKYAGAASHWCWNLKSSIYHQRNYWQPFQTGFAPNLNTAVDQLTEAVCNAVHIRTLPRLAPIVTYISGGMDSRVILFAAADPNCMYGLNLYDRPNREAAIAQQLCEAATVQYIGFAREADYYPRWMRHGVEISGAMWSVEDNHFLGTLDLVKQLEARTVLAAFPVDDLFKGACLEQQYVQLFGRNLPFFEFSSDPVRSFLMESPPRPSPSDFTHAIQQRLQEWFGDLPDRLETEANRLHLEDRRIRPACYQPGLSDNMMFRIVPYDIFLADRAIVDCYSQTRPQWKINATLWSRVVARICGQTIVDANQGWRPGASNAEKLWIFAQDWLKRRTISKLQAQPSVATEGSWSNLGWYATHSPIVQTMWDAPAADRQLITALWGSDPWQVPLNDWANPPTLHRNGMTHTNSPYGLFRILTLLSYFETRRSSRTQS